MTSQTVAGDHTAWKEADFLMKGRLDFNKIMILTDHPKGSRKNKFTILGVEAPGWQGTKT